MSVIACRERLGRIGRGRGPGPVCGHVAVAMVASRQSNGIADRRPVCDVHVKTYSPALFLIEPLEEVQADG